jgi:hypothetical protein
MYNNSTKLMNRGTTMVKFSCDKCGSEVKTIFHIPYYDYATDAHGAQLYGFPRRADLCSNCHERYKRLNLDIDDFMRFSEKELSFLESTFRVGDEVITSTGQVGTIVDICTCDQCKERGFYEPTVETKIGNGTIYITDNDKRVGFRSFYKIGERVFGNIDKDSLLYDIKRINEEMVNLSKQRIELESQRDVVEYYSQLEKEK